MHNTPRLLHGIRRGAEHRTWHTNNTECSAAAPQLRRCTVTCTPSAGAMVSSILICTIFRQPGRRGGKAALLAVGGGQAVQRSGPALCTPGRMLQQARLGRQAGQPRRALPARLALTACLSACRQLLTLRGTWPGSRRKVYCWYRRTSESPASIRPNRQPMHLQGAGGSARSACKEGGHGRPTQCRKGGGRRWRVIAGIGTAGTWPPAPP